MPKSQPIVSTAGCVWTVRDGEAWVPPPEHWTHNPEEATQLPVLLPKRFSLKQGKQKRTVRIFEQVDIPAQPEAAMASPDGNAGDAGGDDSDEDDVVLRPSALKAIKADYETVERKLTDLKETLFRGRDITAKQLFEHDGALLASLAVPGSGVKTTPGS